MEVIETNDILGISLWVFEGVYAIDNRNYKRKFRLNIIE